MKIRQFQIACTLFLKAAFAVVVIAVPKPLDAQMQLYGTIGNRYADECLQPVNGSTQAGAAIVLEPCTDQPVQQWQSMAATSGFANFRNQLSGMCLDAEGSAANHTPVQQMPCFPSDPKEYWAYTFRSGVDTTVFSGIAGSNPAFCLDIPGGQKTPGLAVQIYGCNGTVSQNWYYTGLYAAKSLIGSISSIAARLCIQPAGRSTAAGAAIVQQPCSSADDPAQTWTVVAYKGIYYHYVNQLSGMCLDAPGNGSPKNHDPIEQWPCNTISNEYWVYNPVKPGTTGPVFLYSGKAGSYPTFCLDVPGGQNTPGLALQVYTCNYTVSQQWQ